MSELKPCPFCGGEARPMAQHWDDGSHVWWVECRVCGADAKRCDDGLEAIAAWNARAERTCEMLPTHSDLEITLTSMSTGITRAWGYRQCSNCLCNVFEGAKFCPNCGAEVVE